MNLPHLTTREILELRGPKNDVDENVPYAFFTEPEYSARGRVEDVATIFLTNRECPFRCLMCDLWKNTTDETVSAGAIPRQIDYALERIPPAQIIKLYNSGNFFDRNAIPRKDHAAILQRVKSYDRVIIENHPRFCDQVCVDLAEQIDGQLEIAIGLETIHPEVWPRLNKQMTPDDFRRAVEFLVAAGIDVRTFILLRPPFLSEDEGVEWALKSVEFAFDCGVNCCAVIPTRGGNGSMEQLAAAGQFAPPEFSSLEHVLAAGLKMQRGRVFVDLWDAEQFCSCKSCMRPRIDRLNEMNLTQVVLPRVVCSDCEMD